MQYVLSVWYLNKEIRNEVDFLHADEHQRQLQLIIFMWKMKIKTGGPAIVFSSFY